MKKHFIPLALGGLAIGSTEFVIMGMLPEVASSLKITIPEAGHLISAYAGGVVIGAPLLVAALSRYKPKFTLMALMVLFTVFNGISALAPGYCSLLVARFFSGLPHGAFFGIGTVVAMRLAAEGKQAQAISKMFAGLTLANLAMVPLLTYVGHAFGWRTSFALVASLGALTVFALKAWLPLLPVLSTISVKEELQFFKTGNAWLILLITGVGFGGLFAWFSYISPLMTTVAGLSIHAMPWIMVLAGAGMVTGNYIGGLIADRMVPIKASMLMLSIMASVLVLVFLFSNVKPAAIVLTFVCGALSMAVGSPFNLLMIRTAEKSQTMGAAFMQAAFNVANSLGAFLGAVPIAYGYAFNYPSLVGAGMAVMGLLLCLVFALKNKPAIKQRFAFNA